jgi:hypothetical protein
MTYHAPRTSERELIEIVFPSSVELIVLARFTAATVGARANFDLDEIDDLRLAVDELSVSFGPLDSDTCLRYEFVRDDDTVSVRCTREPTAGDSRVDRPVADPLDWRYARELSEQLLDELVTAHGREISYGRSVAWLTKRRGTGTA